MKSIVKSVKIVVEGLVLIIAIIQLRKGEKADKIVDLFQNYSTYEQLEN